MQNENIALQAKVFLFHLNNSNDENGIRRDEEWKLRQVTETAKEEIERNYYPTVFTKVDRKIMEEFSNNVLMNLKLQPKIKVTDLFIDTQIGAEYLIAFSPSRLRR
ncbi:hypothetical protein [Pedobacter rhizosphaerae]|uniref:Uncharacterized protein n=1 Tax=Pedobacter rhizosphaerae TaxID=390241 RepID=A0A1H9P7U8_9SPHI|nr:hypothetical protein [Pedobacter rhizosphaerae]SER43955.1 hypothetical protein SAMN04488023_10959 [Pedobacter rhizosphaerae]